MTNDNVAEYVHEDDNEENINKVDSDNDESHVSSRKTLSEIQNISIPLKRKDET